MATVTATIHPHPGTPPTVTPDPIVISPQDEILWKCSENFTVVFQPTPFAKPAFNNVHNQSGPPAPAILRGMQLYFKYTVVVDQDVSDPGVIVTA
jgi:hypothetical protein